jgi:hypothetical protein
MILEGSSVATVACITGAQPGTILKLLVFAGNKCEKIMATRIVNVKVRDVEADELWSFMGIKQKPLRPEDDQNKGDA